MGNLINELEKEMQEIEMITHEVGFAVSENKICANSDHCPTRVRAKPDELKVIVFLQKQFIKPSVIKFVNRRMNRIEAFVKKGWKIEFKRMPKNEPDDHYQKWIV